MIKMLKLVVVGTVDIALHTLRIPNHRICDWCDAQLDG